MILTYNMAWLSHFNTAGVL